MIYQHSPQSNNRDAKLNDVSNEVLDQLTASCAECLITSDIIDKQSFSCFSDSPSHATYRARLQGTSETDSGSLISLIEKWVSDGATIVMTGLLIKVDPRCSVQISSFNERECFVTINPNSTPGPNAGPTDSTTDSTGNTVSPGAIIGGIVSVLVILIIAISMVILILKYCCGNLKKIK